MAFLRNEGTGECVTPRGRCLVGRSPRADMRLTGQATSSEHATISWDGSQWSLRDLTSRNGTRINDLHLTGREWRLVPGDRIVFGDPSECWIWVDGSPPKPQAIRDDDVLIEGSTALLLLPDQEAPTASIYPHDDHWEMDELGATSVADGDIVSVGGRRFRLSLPSLSPNVGRTYALTEARDLSKASATFRVSLDEETVELTIDNRGNSSKFSPRRLHYMLLLLARARAADSSSGVESEEAGWVYADVLAKQLATSCERVNLDVHRARQQIARTEHFSNPEEIVQRRRNTGQLRFGIAAITIEEARGKPDP